MSQQLSKLIRTRLDGLLANTGDMALKRRARRIVENINPQDDEEILDVGCGDGYYLHLLSSLGLKLKLTGADSDPNALRSAQKNLKGKRIKLIDADLMNKLPFGDDSFDKIVMSEVAEHLPDDSKGLGEVYRILRPGGTLCLSVPNANYPFFWDPVNWIAERIFGIHINEGFWSGIWHQHRRLYKPKEIRKVITKAGFRIEKIGSLTFWCFPFHHYLINIGARALHSGTLPPELSASISKYSKDAQHPLLIRLAFGIVSAIDKINDLWQPKDSGVGVFVKAFKL